MTEKDLAALKARAHKRIETPGAPWITGTEVLALIAAAEENKRLREENKRLREALEADRATGHPEKSR